MIQMTDTNVDIIPQELITALKDQRAEMDRHYAKLIAQPYNCQHLIHDIQRQIVQTVTILMEFNIPIEVPKKERTIEDVVREAAGEAGMLLGSKAMASGVSFYRRVKDSVESRGGIPANAEVVDEEEIDVYQDDDGFFYIDPDTDEEVACDEFGNPLED